MLVLTMQVGEAFTIEDVLVTLVSSTPESAEVTLQKNVGGEKSLATLPINEYVDACYNSQFIYIESRDSTARIGIEADRQIPIHRKPAL